MVTVRTIRRKRQVVYEKKNFYLRLKLLGHRSYLSYTQSEHWASKKAEYRNSQLPQYCLICCDSRYILHHRSYVRLGDESLMDFIPLCNSCHTKMHQYLKEHTDVVLHSPKLIEDVFGFSNQEAKAKLSLISKNGYAYKFKDGTRRDILTKYTRKKLKKFKRKQAKK